MSALTGLKVRLPQSFVQISVRTSASAGDLKPALVKSSDSAAMRSVFCAVDFGKRKAMALDVPDDARAFDLRRLIADAGDDGVDRQIDGDDPAGIDAFELDAFVRSAMLEKYHQGMPFCVVMTIVVGPTIEATSAAIGASWWALTARTMRSAPPASAMRSVAPTRATISSPFSFSTSPRSRIAFRCSPRATTLTLSPAAASLAAMWPPIAPAPMMVMFIARSEPMPRASQLI